MLLFFLLNIGCSTCFCFFLLNIGYPIHFCSLLDIGCSMCFYVFARHGMFHVLLFFAGHRMFHVLFFFFFLLNIRCSMCLYFLLDTGYATYFYFFAEHRMFNVLFFAEYRMFKCYRVEVQTKNRIIYLYIVYCWKLSACLQPEVAADDLDHQQSRPKCQKGFSTTLRSHHQSCVVASW